MVSTITLVSSLVLGAILISLPFLVYYFRKPSVRGISNASPWYPLIGNSAHWGMDPIKFLLEQRAKLGNVFLVDLAVIRVVFFLGPEGTNAILKGTDSSGIGFWAAMDFVIGEAIKKGWAAPKFVEDAQRMAAKTLSSTEYIEAWKKLVKPIAKAKFLEWAESGDPIAIFYEMSTLVMTLVVNIVLGPEFAQEYGEEIVPMIQAYEQALQKPQTKVFPRWMSNEGKTMEYVEARFTQLIGQEITKRLADPKKFRNNKDYFQALLNTLGGEHVEPYAVHLLVFCIAGHTNQTSTTVWTLLHAMKSPLLEQLRQTKSKDLLDATFRESGRLYTNLMLLRKITIPQEVNGIHLPKGTFVACSPVATARDPEIYKDADSFRPERWLNDNGELDETRIKHLHRIGASTQFGKGQHACIGEKLARFMVMDLLWGIILGDKKDPGFDVEIVDGVQDGVGIDGVGVEAAWIEENLGTPSGKGGPLWLRFSRRET